MPQCLSTLFTISVVALAAMTLAIPAARSTTADTIASFLDVGSCESACAKACERACPAPIYCGYTSSCDTHGAKTTCTCTCATSCFRGSLMNMI